MGGVKHLANLVHVATKPKTRRRHLIVEMPCMSRWQKYDDVVGIERHTRSHLTSGKVVKKTTLNQDHPSEGHSHG